MTQVDLAQHVRILLQGNPGLKAKTLVSLLGAKGVVTDRRQVNGLLYGALADEVEKDSQHRWRLSRVGGGVVSARPTAWTEDQTAVVYWALPIMRSLTEVTGRPFSAIAMKMANLLSVDTDGREGLSNSSALDRAVVAKYRNERDALESRAAALLAGAPIEDDRANEIRSAALALLSELRVPLHADLIAEVITARDPSKVCRRSTVASALRDAPGVIEQGDCVFIVV